MAIKPFNYKKYEEPAPFEYGDYTENDAVAAARQRLTDHEGTKPGAYVSENQAAIDAAMDKILNRDKFTFDVNGDALYQQYKDQYTTQGKMAMMDTMGQAAAMNGGYGSSYAQSVGQQAYQGYMQQLNDKVPELYKLALDKYTQEGDAMLQNYSLLTDQDDRAYSRHRDSVEDWNNDYTRLRGEYQDERDSDYGRYVDDRDFAYGKYSDDRSYGYQKYTDGRDFAYGQHRDKVADDQWQKTFDYNKKQDEKAERAAAAEKTAEEEENKNKFPSASEQETYEGVLDGYGEKKDLAGFEKYLDMHAGKDISEGYADYLYEMYMAKYGDEDGGGMDDVEDKSIPFKERQMARGYR